LSSVCDGRCIGRCVCQGDGSGIGLVAQILLVWIPPKNGGTYVPDEILQILGQVHRLLRNFFKNSFIRTQFIHAILTNTNHVHRFIPIVISPESGSSFHISILKVYTCQLHLDYSKPITPTMPSGGKENFKLSMRRRSPFLS